MINSLLKCFFLKATSVRHASSNEQQSVNQAEPKRQLGAYSAEQDVRLGALDWAKTRVRHSGRREDSDRSKQSKHSGYRGEAALVLASY